MGPKASAPTNSDDVAALLDVDHTLILGDDSLNQPLIQALIDARIFNIFLFTDMTIEEPAISDRKALIQSLKESGFNVCGVLTPNDVTWDLMDLNECAMLYDLCFTKDVYRGKLFGKDFQDFIVAHGDLRALSDAVTRYQPHREGARLGAGYHDGAVEMAESGSLSMHTKKKAIFAKSFCDHLSEKHGYGHNKGLLLDFFVKNMPPWVGSIVVVDDNVTVVKDVSSFRPTTVPRVSQDSSRAVGEPALITVIPITGPHDIFYYNKYLLAHTDRCQKFRDSK